MIVRPPYGNPYGKEAFERMVNHRLQAVLERIAKAAASVGRDPAEIRLLAVSKRHPASAVAQLHAAGQIDFGENYVQEAARKVGHFREEGAVDKGICWHLIGPLQTNKAKRAVELFHWIHTLDRGKLVDKLEQQAERLGRKVNVLIQVNSSGEETKSGARPDEVLALARKVRDCRSLVLRGLMVIPAAVADPEEARPQFRLIAELLKETRQRLGLERMEELSMGMSFDLEVAVQEGATITRVGTALFGGRPA